MQIGYARVSTHEQNLDLQKDALKKAGCEKIVVDVASGKKTQRSGLDQVRELLRKRDVLVVWRLDRLGRSLKHLIELMTELEQAGIGFQSLQEHIDTTSPGGKLVFHIFGALAEFERNLIQERTKAGPGGGHSPRSGSSPWRNASSPRGKSSPAVHQVSRSPGPVHRTPPDRSRSLSTHVPCAVSQGPGDYGGRSVREPGERGKPGCPQLRHHAEGKWPSVGLYAQRNPTMPRDFGVLHAQGGEAMAINPRVAVQVFQVLAGLGRVVAEREHEHVADPPFHEPDSQGVQPEAAAFGDSTRNTA